jgi:hypothetical protein
MNQITDFLYLNVLPYSVFYHGMGIFLTDFTLAIPLPAIISQQKVVCGDINLLQYETYLD